MPRLGNPSLLFSIGAIMVAFTALYLAPLHGLLSGISDRSLFGRASSVASPSVYDAAKDVTYLGSRTPGVDHFQNIFYGEDTSGPNRFAPPIPVQLEKGSVIDATQPGAWCPQGLGDIFPFTSKVVNVSENCLSLRIARPAGTDPDANLPVAVWLHGGGHALGSAYDILYEPDGIVRQAAHDGQPLIWVAINYRLGLFGFATSEALKAAKHTNAALRDQRAALEWVRDNIRNFGGDPNRVTAIGQSVGASDIGLHLTSYRGRKGVPFQQAVMMSGGPGLNFNTQSSLVADNTASIAEQVGCIKGGSSQSAETVQCLREASAETLRDLSVAASRNARPPFGEGFFYPTEDGDMIPNRPSELLRTGEVVKGVPIIASWVTNDGAWYASPASTTDEDVLSSFGIWLTGLSSETKNKLLELYPLSDFEHMVRPDTDGPISPQYYRAAQMNKDLWFTCPVIDFTWQYLKNGGVDMSHISIYEHNSTRFSPVYENMGVPMWRVSHLSDIPYVLNIQHLEGGADNSDEQLELSKKVSRRIVSFVTSGPASPHPSSEKRNNSVENRKWPAAFRRCSRDEIKMEHPSKISLELFGGPYGSVPVSVAKTAEVEVTEEVEVTASRKDAQQALELEKIFQRCEFINSEAVRREIGV
ncbi:alpha/beta-hydrolase [Poronia punctata]|nr:alpha/beta-hydrolase [Poronia punctata]